MPGTIQRLVAAVVIERKTLVRTCGREADDVAVGADAARNALAELEQNARRIRIRIRDGQRLVRFEMRKRWLDDWRGIQLVPRLVPPSPVPAPSSPPPLPRRRSRRRPKIGGGQHLPSCRNDSWNVLPWTRRYAYRRGFLKDWLGTPTGPASRSKLATRLLKPERHVEMSRHIQ